MNNAKIAHWMRSNTQTLSQNQPQDGLPKKDHPKSDKDTENQLKREEETTFRIQWENGIR